MSAEKQLVVVANRLPVRSVARGRERTWETSPGGLVSALAPVIAVRKNTSWVGWTGSADAPPEPFEHDGIQLKPVGLSRAEIQLYYEGFANGTLWPLYHDAISPPVFRRTWWDAYELVNQRFAAEIESVAKKNATVWIHDYQLQLVPGMLRESRPDLRIGFFLHIPFPARELFLRLPWRTQLAKGLLGADVLGFQTEVSVHNFRHVLPRVTEASVKGSAISFGGREVVARCFPIGIEFDRFNDAASAESTAARATQIRTSLGSPTTLILGVDRLDYTKGIDRRLRAYDELLVEGRIDVDNTVMVQIAEPSRSNVNGYSEIQSQVEQLVGQINGGHGTVGHPAVHYLHRGQDFKELTALYRAADIMVVTPFRDGMNLVAKEYVASRCDNTGVLVLSEFAGAAHQLKQALLVNPYDIDGMKSALEAAVAMPPEEQSRRMKAMRRTVKKQSAEAWASMFLSQLEKGP